MELQEPVPSRKAFVVQHHQSRSPHFDFRLEFDGVFKSWAIPKGIPQSSGIKHLAIQTDDHSLEFGEFEGTIPTGSYGAGTIEIWDRGDYILEECTDDIIRFTLCGERVRGRYQMIRFRRAGEKQWLILKAD